MGIGDSLDLDGEEVDFSINELQVALQKDGVPANFPKEGVALRISGEINLYSAHALKEKIFELIDRGFVYVFVNMENIRYIDSSGLAVFMSTHAKLVKNGKGGIAMFSPSSQVNKILELTKLKTLIRVTTTLEDAANIIVH
ncbi:STAS domain-containing protein [Leptospira ellisii]|uniref:Anti-sigma factor antagonist n=1 Tax=Leptospira ellisii TaxID=2023197 RepID=A0AAE4QMU1_9LEPT|nr:STAS domain-containing protein [Leptospira ellisii]MDV6235441.1 STAS domain-containing protein [Leptospira ellisii]